MFRNKFSKSMTPGDYKQLAEAYFGDGGFTDGLYLKRHARELDEKFRERREICYYLNYVAPVVNSHVGPVFSKPTIRDWKGEDALFSVFMEDVDQEGTSMAHFMKSAALMAKLFGTAYIVVDNMPAEVQPVRRDDAANSRTLPYAYLVHPGDVISIERGLRGSLSRFEYNDGTDERGRLYTRVWTRDGWELNGGDAANSGSHDIGVVPVIALHSRKAVRLQSAFDSLSPQPSEFLSIMRANTRIFNLCSELDEILRNQTFSILAYPGDPKELVIGANSALGWDAANLGSAAPHFIAPPSAPAEMLMTHIDRLIKEIYRMAMLTHATGVAEATSGVAKAWDFEKTNQALADFADNLQAAERQIVELFKRWTGSEIDYICEYPSDFSITDTQQEIMDATSLLALNLKANFAAEIKKRLARIVLEDSSGEAMDRVIAELDAEAADAVYGDSLENPSADDKYTAVGIAQGVIDLLEKIQAGTLAPEAAKIILVATYGLSADAADEAIKAQVGIKNAESGQGQAAQAIINRLAGVQSGISDTSGESGG